MRIELPYGRQKRSFEIEEKSLVGIFSPKDSEPAKDVVTEVIRSLENRVGTHGLRTILRRNRKVAIAVDDNTRATPVRLVLPALIKHFNLRREDVQVIVALGTHRKMTKAEMEEKYGKDTLQEYEFVNHAFDEHEHRKHHTSLYRGVVSGLEDTPSRPSGRGNRGMDALHLSHGTSKRPGGR